MLDTIDFAGLKEQISTVFAKVCDKDVVDRLMEHCENLANDNFECYRANMIAIEQRNSKTNDYKVISDMELIARTVGEDRVERKTFINKLLASSFKEKDSDVSIIDRLYTVGDCIDRMSIEFIKIKAFAVSGEIEKIEHTQYTFNAALMFLEEKMLDISCNGYSYNAPEVRTYALNRE